MKLIPVCGPGADSIGLGLKRLYKSEYPDFRKDVWPARQESLGGFTALMNSRFRPSEEGALSFLSEALGIDFPSSSSLRVIVVSGGVGKDGRLFPLGRGSWIWLAALPDERSDRTAIGSFLVSFCRACDQIDAKTSAFSLLEAALQKTPDGSAIARPVTDALLDHVTESVIANHLDLPTARPEPGIDLPRAGADEVGDGQAAAEYLPIVAKHWDAFLAGNLSMEVACQMIAADASGGESAGSRQKD